MNKKLTISICIVFTVVIIILLGYTFRIDRFGMSKITWIDCVQINDITYSSDFNRKRIKEDSIGEMIGKVKFNVSENVSNPNYRFRNGDATFLKVGTEIFDIESDVNTIAVKVDEYYYLYQSSMAK